MTGHGLGDVPEIRMVHWIDAAHTDGWTDPDDLEDFGVSECCIVGFVLRETGQEILIAQSLDMRHGRVDAVMAIPQAAVTRSQTLQEAA